MPLKDLDLPADGAAPPDDVCAFLREAERRIERFQMTSRSPGFVPGDYAGAYAWLTTDAGDADTELDLSPDDFDVIYAYPWPDEEQVTGELFRRFAAVGAVLVTCNVGEGFRLRRKVGAKRRRAAGGR